MNKIQECITLYIIFDFILSIFFMLNFNFKVEFKNSNVSTEKKIFISFLLALFFPLLIMALLFKISFKKNKK